MIFEFFFKWSQSNQSLSVYPSLFSSHIQQRLPLHCCEWISQCRLQLESQSACRNVKSILRCREHTSQSGLSKPLSDWLSSGVFAALTFLAPWAAVNTFSPDCCQYHNPLRERDARHSQDLMKTLAHLRLKRRKNPAVLLSASAPPL